MSKGYKNKYVRRVYNREAMQRRDFIYEGLKARDCEICGAKLERKITKSGAPEALCDWKTRRTCGMVWDKKENKYVKTKCSLALSLGEKNGNWKGGKNDCLLCGKKVRWYASKNEPQIYCYTCYQTKKMPLLYLTNPHTYKKGNTPKCPFKKGRIATNKIHEYCTIVGCDKKHLAKGLCNKHYQRSKKLLSNPKG